MFAGFDRAGFPGLATMAWLKKNTNLTFYCHYLWPAPSVSKAAKTYVGQYPALAKMGWGALPTFVGQEIAGPGSHKTSGAQGVIDGGATVAVMHKEKFPQGHFVFLDLEDGNPFAGVQKAYVTAWAKAVAASNYYRPGVYCSFLKSKSIHAALPGLRQWCFRVKSVAKHNVAGTTFPTPALSGASPFAFAWQRDDNAVIKANGKSLQVDLDVALTANPGM